MILKTSWIFLFNFCVMIPAAVEGTDNEATEQKGLQLFSDDVGNVGKYSGPMEQRVSQKIRHHNCHHRHRQHSIKNRRRPFKRTPHHYHPYYDVRPHIFYNNHKPLHLSFSNNHVNKFVPYFVTRYYKYLPYQIDHPMHTYGYHSKPIYIPSKLPQLFSPVQHITLIKPQKWYLYSTGTHVSSIPGSQVSFVHDSTKPFLHEPNSYNVVEPSHDIHATFHEETNTDNKPIEVHDSETGFEHTSQENYNNVGPAVFNAGGNEASSVPTLKNHTGNSQTEEAFTYQDNTEHTTQYRIDFNEEKITTSESEQKSESSGSTQNDDEDSILSTEQNKFFTTSLNDNYNTETRDKVPTSPNYEDSTEKAYTTQRADSITEFTENIKLSRPMNKEKNAQTETNRPNLDKTFDLTTENTLNRDQALESEEISSESTLDVVYDHTHSSNRKPDKLNESFGHESNEGPATYKAIGTESNNLYTSTSRSFYDQTFHESFDYSGDYTTIESSRNSVESNDNQFSNGNLQTTPTTAPKQLISKPQIIEVISETSTLYSGSKSFDDESEIIEKLSSKDILKDGSIDVVTESDIFPVTKLFQYDDERNDYLKYNTKDDIGLTSGSSADDIDEFPVGEKDNLMTMDNSYNSNTEKITSGDADQGLRDLSNFKTSIHQNSIEITTPSPIFKYLTGNYERELTALKIQANTTMTSSSASQLSSSKFDIDSIATTPVSMSKDFTENDESSATVERTVYENEASPAVNMTGDIESDNSVIDDKTTKILEDKTEHFPGIEDEMSSHEATTYDYPRQNWNSENNNGNFDGSSGTSTSRFTNLEPARTDESVEQRRSEVVDTSRLEIATSTELSTHNDIIDENMLLMSGKPKLQGVSNNYLTSKEPLSGYTTLKSNSMASHIFDETELTPATPEEEMIKQSFLGTEKTIEETSTESKIRFSEEPVTFFERYGGNKFGSSSMVTTESEGIHSEDHKEQGSTLATVIPDEDSRKGMTTSILEGIRYSTILNDDASEKTTYSPLWTNQIDLQANPVTANILDEFEFERNNQDLNNGTNADDKYSEEKDIDDSGFWFAENESSTENHIASGLKSYTEPNFSDSEEIERSKIEEPRTTFSIERSVSETVSSQFESQRSELEVEISVPGTEIQQSGIEKSESAIETTESRTELYQFETEKSEIGKDSSAFGTEKSESDSERLESGTEISESGIDISEPKTEIPPSGIEKSESGTETPESGILSESGTEIGSGSGTERSELGIETASSGELSLNGNTGVLNSNNFDGIHENSYDNSDGVIRFYEELDTSLFSSEYATQNEEFDKIKTVEKEKDLERNHATPGTFGIIDKSEEQDSLEKATEHRHLEVEPFNTENYNKIEHQLHTEWNNSGNGIEPIGTSTAIVFGDLVTQKSSTDNNGMAKPPSLYEYSLESELSPFHLSLLNVNETINRSLRTDQTDKSPKIEEITFYNIKNVEGNSNDNVFLNKKTNETSQLSVIEFIDFDDDKLSNDYDLIRSIRSAPNIFNNLDSNINTKSGLNLLNKMAKQKNNIEKPRYIVKRNVMSINQSAESDESTPDEEEKRPKPSDILDTLEMNSKAGYQGDEAYMDDDYENDYEIDYDDPNPLDLLEDKDDEDETLINDPGPSIMELVLKTPRMNQRF